MKRFMKRPAIVLAMIFAIIFLVIFFESCLLDELSKSNAHESCERDEKFFDYEQELETVVKPDEIKSAEPISKPEITLGVFKALDGTCFRRGERGYRFEGPDKFTDLQNIADGMRWLPDIDHTKSDKLVDLLDLSQLSESHINSYVRFYSEISRYQMYSPKSNVSENILYDMQTQPIFRIYETDVGSQFKLQIFFDNEVIALFKPKRTSREQQAPPNQVHIAEFERHTSEIAAYHLDRILGFYRALPTIGRNVNMVVELMRVSPPRLQRTFFISAKPDENMCFSGNCKLYCDSYHPTCGNGTTIEGSFSVYLPDFDGMEREASSHPWLQAIDQNNVAEWETNPNYCDDVKMRPEFAGNHLLLELIDLSILDFLTGNMNRYSYEQFKAFQSDSFVLAIDNGKGFGRAYHDELRILAPMLQCCMVKSSTLITLLDINNGEQPLSSRMRDSMKDDPIAPVLWEAHLTALDRRLVIVLQAIRDCVNRNGADNVIIVPNNANST